MYNQVLCVLFLLFAAEAAKILGIFMSPSYSHQIVYQPIWRELSLRGHQVTVYTPNPLKDPTLTNLTEVDLSFSYGAFNNNFNKLFLSSKAKNDHKIISQAYKDIFAVQMSSPEMKKLVTNANNEQYDLFLVEYLFPFMNPFKDIYKCLMVGIVSLPLTSVAAEALGMSKHPVLDPEFILSFATNLSFKERVISTVFSYMLKVQIALSTSALNTLVRKYFGEHSRDAMTIRKEVSLVLGNTNLALENIRPTVPGFIGISGIHLRPLKPLPQDLKYLLDEATQGVIYFSLGTNVKSHLMPKEKREFLLSAFAELPYKVLWKFETDDIGDLPSNVEIRKWLPQHDVLRHPNIKLFITQGGLQSLDEAFNSTVPLLVIPFFGDQHFNADKVVKNGAGLSLDFYDFTKGEFVEKIQKLILDPSYKEAATKLGAIASDEPIPPLEKAVWWIEYVLRHKGAPHLRYKAVDLPFYQYYLLDVHLFLAFIVFLVSYILLKVFKILPLVYHFFLRLVEIPSISSKKSQ